MSKTSKIIIVMMILALLLLGIGYAAILNVTLNITGTATSNASQENFKVKFSGTPIISDSDKVKASITDDLNATINVEGLTEKGDSVSITYTIQNSSPDLSTDLLVTTSNSNEEYFLLDAELAKTSLISGEATTLTITIELIKTPIKTEEKSTIGIQLTVAPVQPGEEGTSEIAGGSSETQS